MSTNRGVETLTAITFGMVSSFSSLLPEGSDCVHRLPALPGMALSLSVHARTDCGAGADSAVTTLGPQMPTTAEMNACARGKRLGCAPGWREFDGRWQCISHHVLGEVK